MEVKTHVCDAEGCGITKGAANHWFRVYSVNGGLLLMAWDGSPPTDREGYYPPLAGEFCGQKHAIEFISKNVPQKQAANSTED